MLTTTVCAALSAAGLAIAFLTAWRRRFVRATRIAALSLLPVGLAMSGLVKLGGKVGKAFGDWAADLVMKPTVWTGFGVLAVAVVLYVIARVAGSRAEEGSGRTERKAARGGDAPPAAAPGAGTPALGRAPEPAQAPAKKPKKSGGAGAGSEDFSDIEAILKKHGI
ncbi:hypothetical protein [Streptomyces boncukensis]|uniref:Cellulose synthase n=1 Tax=Streptomyces boncukensis TaxID=2711219 RepID=A0A6G4X314_9ACTN|nr:hypothetical protein [Streptomyces boncukensis]NGO71929.1 hypothetical protein [Streptomyces boncukensis]